MIKHLTALDWVVIVAATISLIVLAAHVCSNKEGPEL
jgi:hypothetical protein